MYSLTDALPSWWLGPSKHAGRQTHHTMLVSMQGVSLASPTRSAGLGLFHEGAARGGQLLGLVHLLW